MLTNRITRPEAPSHGRVQEMAKAIADTAREKGEVTRRDLLAKGFTPTEIDRLGDRAMAASRAGREG